MNNLIEKHHIEERFYIYLQANSNCWYARFKIGGRWFSRATKERDKAKAINGAIRVKTECDIMHKHGIAVQTKSFRDVAERAIARMKLVPKEAKGFASMIDYELTLKKYHIPFFDRTHITSIDYEKLSEFDKWRTGEMGRTPAQSTLKTHNAALQRVFDEAVLNKWMTESQIPSLTASGGAAGQRRDYFTPAEISRIDAAFPAWIAESRKEVTWQIRDCCISTFILRSTLAYVRAQRWTI